MKKLYILSIAIFIVLTTISATYGDTESSNLSMGFFKEMDPDVTVVYVAANLSDTNTSNERLAVWDIPVSEITIAECSYGGRTDDSQYKIKKPEEPYALWICGRQFTPTERLDSRIQNKLASVGEDDYTYGYVMISGEPTNAKRDALTEHGVKLLGYHQPHSYAAKIPLNRIEELGNLSFVRWIGYAPYDLKIPPTLKKKVSSGSDDEIRVYINVFDSDLNEKSEKIVHGGETQYDGERQYVNKQYYTYITNGPFQNKLEEMGATILAYDDRYGRMIFTVRAAPETINEIADLDFVQFIEPGYPMEELGGDCLTEGKMVGSMRSPSTDGQLEQETNTDEPSEQEEMTTGDSNPGIVTIVRMAFAYIQRRLI